MSDKDISHLLMTINPLNTMKIEVLDSYQGCFAISYHENNLLKKNRFFINEDWIAVFAGDLIEKVDIPWTSFFNSLDKRDYKVLCNLNGNFAITILNKKKNMLYIISDRRSQSPIYYLLNNNSKIYVSTELSTFCRLPIDLSLNVKWLWEYLFFNFPIGQTTYLKNVKRMPPACVLELNINSGKYLFYEYSGKFNKKINLLEDKEALEYAYSVFKKRIPKYFSGTENIACALTAGWDGRTLLSFCPNIKNVKTYTYGVSGCNDLKKASETAKALNIEHQKILFDKDFIDKLPSLIFDTVYLSSGQERITRSTLLWVYRKLTEGGNKYPLVISGISLDMQLRGHANIPSLISPDMANIFSTGKKNIDEKFWIECMGKYYKPFKRHILKRIGDIEKRYGKLSSSDTHLSYILYELSPKYFAGELSIAKLFTTVRVPSWDNDIIDLSYSIKNSTLFFSQFLPDHKRGNMNEMILQAYMISKNNEILGVIPVNGIPPKTFSKGKYCYQFTRIKNLAPKMIYNKILSKNIIPPLEDWNKWLEGPLKNVISQLIFTKNSMIRNYVNPEYIISLEKKPSDRFIEKFATIEIISRLIKSGWNREVYNEN